jgi:hypothetical protein
MNKSTRQDIPSENEIEKLLGSFKPYPSARFEKRMENAPWQPVNTSRISSIKYSNKYLPHLISAVSIFLVILLLGTALLFPQVRAIAKQIIYSFISAPSNEIEVQVTPSNPGDLFNYSDPSNFPLNVPAAQQQAGFEIEQISPMPGNLSLRGARFEPDYQSVILLYQGDKYVLFLTQRPLGNGQDVFSIGEDATVVLVNIGNLQGEYVEGGWKALSTQPTSDHQTTQKQINITAVWDNSLPQSTLRWKAEGMTYELRAVGEDRPPQSELIKWANELK